VDLPSDFPFEITCVTTSGKAMGLGPLENGFVFNVPVHVVQALQSTKKQGGSLLLASLGKITPFEVVIGVNGMIWVKSKNEITNVLLAKVIQESAKVRPEEHYKILPAFRESLAKLQGYA
jgi:exosome complex component RRP40